MYCPTGLMKADGLTKLQCSVQQRRLLLHHITDPRFGDIVDSNEVYEDYYSSYLCFSLCGR